MFPFHQAKRTFCSYWVCVFSAVLLLQLISLLSELLTLSMYAVIASVIAACVCTEHWCSDTDRERNCSEKGTNECHFRYRKFHVDGSTIERVVPRPEASDSLPDSWSGLTELCCAIHVCVCVFVCGECEHSLYCACLRWWTLFLCTGVLLHDIVSAQHKSWISLGLLAFTRTSAASLFKKKWCTA